MITDVRQPRMRERYRGEVVDALRREFLYANMMQVPTIHKIVVNIGMGEAVANPKALDAATRDLTILAGQKPVITKAKKSVASFKLRAGMPIGAMATLRGERMWEFMDRLVSTALPRIRDFQGISPKAFDGRGNYTLGLRDQLAFVEIDYDQIDRLRGLEISIVTTARTDEEGRRLLQLLGMPFRAA